jgi:hypothetical protein
MCSIITKLIQDRRQKNTRCIWDFRFIWDFILQIWSCKLLKDYDYRLDYNLNCFKDCIWNWLTTNCTNSHTLQQRMEKDHNKSKDSHNVRSWHWQSQKTSSCSHIDYISTIAVKTHYKWTTFHHFSPKEMMYNKYNRCVIN